MRWKGKRVGENVEGEWAACDFAQYVSLNIEGHSVNG